MNRCTNAEQVLGPALQQCLGGGRSQPVVALELGIASSRAGRSKRVGAWKQHGDGRIQQGARARVASLCMVSRPVIPRLTAPPRSGLGWRLETRRWRLAVANPAGCTRWCLNPPPSTPARFLSHWLARIINRLGGERWHACILMAAAAQAAVRQGVLPAWPVGGGVVTLRCALWTGLCQRRRSGKPESRRDGPALRRLLLAPVRCCAELFSVSLCWSRIVPWREGLEKGVRSGES